MCDLYCATFGKAVFTFILLKGQRLTLFCAVTEKRVMTCITPQSFFVKRWKILCVTGGRTDEQARANPLYFSDFILDPEKKKSLDLLELRASASHFVYVALLCWAFGAELVPGE